jgi:hypothetical protein
LLAVLTKPARAERGPKNPRDTQEKRDRERQEMEKPKIRKEEVKKGSEMEKF